jgi:tetratricopeptide (TPR) repeat protein
VAGRLDAAEMFARRALVASPEHPGALVEVARVEAARARAGETEAYRRSLRLYALAERLLGKGAEGIAEEHAAFLIAASEAELARGGRVALVEGWLGRVASLEPGGRRYADLQVRLAAFWAARGAVVPARAALDEARRAGAGDPGLRARVEWLEATRDKARSERFATTREAMDKALGGDAKAWGEVASWCMELGDLATAEWAARKAVARDRRQTALAEVLARGRRWDEAAAAWQEAAAGARVVERGGILARALVVLRAGGSRDAVASVASVEDVLGAAWLASLDEDPRRWAEVVSGAWSVGLVRHAATLARRARKARQVGAAWEEVRALIATGSSEGIEAPLDAAIDEARRGAGDGLGLGRVLFDRRDVERLGRLATPLEEAAGAPARAWAAAASALLRGESSAARATLEEALRDVPPLMAEQARVAWAVVDPGVDAAAWGLDAARRQLELADGAARAEAERALGRLGTFFGRTAPGRVDQALEPWLKGLEARRPAAADLELARTAAQLRRGDEVQVAILGVLARGGDTQREGERIALLRRLGRIELLEDAIAAEALREGGVAGLEKAAEKARQDQNQELAAGLFARLDPSEIARGDILPDIARLFGLLGEWPLAQSYADELLGRSEAGAQRLVVLGEFLLESGDLDRAARAFGRAFERGDRSARSILGWVRALARGAAGDLEVVANQWLETRKGDARTADELLRALIEEGEHERARVLAEARLGATERVEPGLFGTLADLYRVRGDRPALEALARRFASSDPRAPAKTIVLAAQKLIDAGARGAALNLLEDALASRPRDPTLLSVLVATLAVGPSEPLEAATTRLVAELGRNPDAWDKLITDLWSAGHAELAHRLADRLVADAPDEPIVRLAKGRLELATGARENAVAEFVAAVDRADEPRQIAELLEPTLRAAQFPEGLVAVLKATSARSPGRADLSVDLARALLAAHRPEEAAQIFLKASADSDRAYPLIAAEWARAGHASRALEAWDRGFEQIADGDLRSAFETASSFLLADERLDGFIQRFRIASSTLDGPSMLAIVRVLREAGRPEALWRELAWADSRGLTVDLARARLDLALEVGDIEAMRSAARAWVVRVAGVSSSGRAAAGGLALAVDEVVERMLASGEAALAVETVAAARQYEPSSPTLRLIEARARLHAEGLGAALRLLETPLSNLRGNRDVARALRPLLEDLISMGFVNVAHELLGAALLQGADREVWLGGLRLAARSGHPEVAEAIANRLAVEMPALNGWLVADLLLAERMPAAAARFSLAALRLGVQGPAMQRALLVHELATGLGARDIVSRVPRLRAGEPRVIVGQAEAQAVGAGPLVLALSDAHATLLPTLAESQPDPGIQKAASDVAGTSGSAFDDRPLAALLETLGQARGDRLKLFRALGTELAAAGYARAAARTFDVVETIAPKDPGLLVQAFEQDLVAGLATEDANARLAQAEAARFALVELAALHGRGALARELSVPLPVGLRTRLGPAMALAADDLDAFGQRVEAACSASPDPVRARLELARRVLLTHPPTEPKPAEITEVILAPLLGADRAPELALALGAIAALRVGDTRGADALLERLAARFPGRLAEATALLETALGATDGDAVRRLNGLYTRIAPSEREDTLAALLAAHRMLAQGPVGAAARTFLEARVAELHGRDLGRPRRGLRLEVELLLALGRGDEAVATLAAAREIDPGALEPALLEVDALLALGRAELAQVRAKALFSRTTRGGLFEAEARLLAPVWSAAVWQVRARVERARGQVAEARAALAKAVASSPATARAPLRALAAELAADAAAREGALGDCLARAEVPWSGWCRRAR